MSERPRILHVARGLDPKLGGTSYSVPSLARYTRETGRSDNALGVFRTPDDKGGTSHIGLPEFRIHQIPWDASSPSQMIQAYKQLSALIREQAVVQIHGIWQAQTAMAAHLARSMKKPYFVSAHGMLDTWALRNKQWKKTVYAAAIERSNLQHAKCMVALTRREYDNYRAFGLRTPIAVIPNGVAAPDQSSPDLFYSKWPELKGKRIVLFLSRVHYKKGLDILSQAWRSISKTADDLHLVIAGPDSEGTRQGLEKYVREEGLGKSVTFTGMMEYDTKWSALAASSLFILPSYSEGFSIAILEALAAAKPVIVTHQCNFPDLEGKEFARVIEPVTGEVEEALRSMLQLPSATLREYGIQAREFVQRKYSWQQIGQAMADVYGWTLEGKQPSHVEILLS